MEKDLSPSDFNKGVTADSVLHVSELVLIFEKKKYKNSINSIINFLLQLISYKRNLECTLIQWRLSIYP